VAGTASTVVAAWLMSRRSAADPKHITNLLSLFVAASVIPSFLAYWVDSTRTATVYLWLFVPGVYFYIGPILGLLQNVVPASMRATTCALLLFTANIANLLLAPQI